MCTDTVNRQPYKGLIMYREYTDNRGVTRRVLAATYAVGTGPAGGSQSGGWGGGNN